ISRRRSALRRVDSKLGRTEGSSCLSTTPKGPPAPARRWTAPFLIALLAASLAGCAGEGGVPTGGSGPGDGASFATVQEEVFDRRCVSTTCHAAGSLAGGLSLVADQ